MINPEKKPRHLPRALLRDREVLADLEMTLTVALQPEEQREDNSKTPPRGRR